MPRLFLSPPDVGSAEVEFVLEAFESNWVAPIGPQLDAFEREFAAYCGIGECVAVGNGTDALEIALRTIVCGPGDEVVTAGGIVCKIREINDNFVSLEVADGVTVILNLDFQNALLALGGLHRIPQACEQQ